MPKSSQDEAEIRTNVARVLADPTRRYGPDELDALSVLEQVVAKLRWDIRHRRCQRGKRLDAWNKQAIEAAERQIAVRQEAIRRLRQAGLRAERPWVDGEPPLLLGRLQELEAEACAATQGRHKQEALLHHTIALMTSPAYLTESSDGARQDWAHVPLARKELLTSAELGRQVAVLLDTEHPVLNVTTGEVRPELRTIAVPTTMLAPGAFDFRVTAGWGHASQGGVMPGKGKLLTRAYRPDEQPEQSHLALLGKSTHDIYLNDTAYWRNVPEKVWDYSIGGYQVVKKWLSYREHELLGRPLTMDEAREVTHMARRLSALLLLAPALDANYAAAKATATPLPADKGRRQDPL